MNINAAKTSVIKAGLRLVESGLITRTWGNVSCRTDENSFVITPSGRDYRYLTTDDLVRVNINNLSYSGAIKPSSEKAVHAEVYKLYPGVSFVIHTHQENASVIAASGLNSIKVGDDYPSLGGEVICAEYALPGTKSLCKKVKKALQNSKGKAVIMKYHGALCFGDDDEETFTVATELEKACHDFVVHHYLRLSKEERYDPLKMYSFALLQNSKINMTDNGKKEKTYCHSMRTEKGFKLYDNEKEIEVQYNKIGPGFPEEAEIYDTIYRKNKNINHIILNNTAEILAVSRSGTVLKPLLDDFAQIVGLQTNNVEINTDKIAKSLRKSSAVIVRNMGALCCGKTRVDAVAVSMIVQKACKAFIGASLFGKVKPINPLESMLMRLVYLKKYSKQAEGDIHTNSVNEIMKI